jgi:probable F420-dependent oxidoreductase
MKIGVVFPQTEYGNDPLAIRDFAQTAETLGFAYVLAFDHVLGVNPNRPGGWSGPYTYQTSFQEPFVLFSFMAAVTRKLGFSPGIIILPQRQTALVAKQAATLDVLSGGRVRLGVGLGWNEVEYISLGQDFHTRGRRIEEQVKVLRLLWENELVNFSGQWHTIPDAGLNPLPVQRPIPIWFGGSATPALKRAARLADGWMTNHKLVAEARPSLDLLARLLEEAGRNREDFGIEPRLPYADGNPDTWHKFITDWEAAGASHISINTMGSGFQSPTEHMNALIRFAETIGIK